MRSPTLPPDVLVGRLAAEHPLATRVFARHGIDFCCGGGRPLDEVCRERGLDPEAVRAEIGAEIAAPGDTSPDWARAPLAELIQHILTTYHEPHYEELPRLEAMARKVFAVHGVKDPERLGELVAVVAGLRLELEQHMFKEEQVLFPFIARGQGAVAQGPIAVMEAEHETAGASLRRLRELTDGYRVPEGACNTWRALWHGLEAFEQDLHQHIHLESNILFPRALRGESV